MHAELLECCRLAREQIAVPSFPLASIRERLERSAPRRRSIVAAIVAGLSLVTIATAAEVLHQTHVTFPSSGGMVFSADNIRYQSIRDEAEIRTAAERLNFSAVLPAGLPEGTKPTHLLLGTDLIGIVYDLPGEQRRLHHLLWIFLANPNTMTSADRAREHIKTGRAMTLSHWRVGPEEVIVASNGLTQLELAAIKRGMQREVSSEP
jgi:hypothetical protein